MLWMSGAYERLVHLTMLVRIEEILEEYKAQDVQVVPLPDFAVADRMVVASGTSSRHLWTLADKLSRAMRDDGVKTVMEGDSSSDWIVLDLGDVIVHFFTPEKRRFYDLEGLWLQRFDDTSAVNVEKDA